MSSISQLIGSLGAGIFPAAASSSQSSTSTSGTSPADGDVLLSSLPCPEPAEVKSQIKLWDCSQPGLEVRGGNAHTERDFNCVVFIELAVNTAGGCCSSRAWEPKVYRSQGAGGDLSWAVSS